MSTTCEPWIDVGRPDPEHVVGVFDSMVTRLEVGWFLTLFWEVA
jgi:hypothetical protein